VAIPTGAVLARLGLPDHINVENAEDEVHSQHSRLWQFQDGLWKDQGAGNAKLLKDGSTGIVRFVFREDKTKKIVQSHYVFDHDEYCDLRPLVGFDNSCAWTVFDYSGDVPALKNLALRFSSLEEIVKFKEVFDKVKHEMPLADEVGYSKHKAPIISWTPSVRNSSSSGAHNASLFLKSLGSDVSVVTSVLPFEPPAVPLPIHSVIPPTAVTQESQGHRPATLESTVNIFDSCASKASCVSARQRRQILESKASPADEELLERLRMRFRLRQTFRTST